MRLAQGKVQRVVKASQQRDAGVAPAKRAAKLPKALQRSEHDEQVALFEWIGKLADDHPARLAFAVPNGARTAISVAKRLKAEGLRAGVPDVVLPVARGKYHGLFVEMKKADGVQSDVSKVQRDWHHALQCEGYYVVAAFGFEQARDIITEYLTLTEG